MATPKCSLLVFTAWQLYSSPAWTHYTLILQLFTYTSTLAEKMNGSVYISMESTIVCIEHTKYRVVIDCWESFCFSQTSVHIISGHIKWCGSCVFLVVIWTQTTSQCCAWSWSNNNPAQRPRLGTKSKEKADSHWQDLWTINQYFKTFQLPTYQPYLNAIKSTTNCFSGLSDFGAILLLNGFHCS